MLGIRDGILVRMFTIPVGDIVGRRETANDGPSSEGVPVEELLLYEEL
jgi:hypothetical protein